MRASDSAAASWTGCAARRSPNVRRKVSKYSTSRRVHVQLLLVRQHARRAKAEGIKTPGALRARSDCENVRDGRLVIAADGTK
eukprot:4679308-Prymnesium_polylepis.1